MTASIRSGWRKINRLESKIEATSRATESGGYFRNIYGGYDRTDLTEDLLGEFQRLVRVAPDAAYRHGAALLRAGRLQQARSAYNQLIPGSSEARLMLAVVEQAMGNIEIAQRLVNEFNEECVSKEMPFMCTSLEKIALRKSYNY